MLWSMGCTVSDWTACLILDLVERLLGEALNHLQRGNLLGSSTHFCPAPGLILKLQLRYCPLCWIITVTEADFSFSTLLITVNMFQDFGIFMSPCDRSYDAIGLMKQVSEQTAAQYANAHEILGNETPKALPKDVPGNNRDENKENNNPQPGNHSQLASKALVKLDFPDTLV